MSTLVERPTRRDVDFARAEWETRAAYALDCAERLALRPGFGPLIRDCNDAFAAEIAAYSRLVEIRKAARI